MASRAYRPMICGVRNFYVSRTFSCGKNKSCALNASREKSRLHYALIRTLSTTTICRNQRTDGNWTEESQKQRHSEETHEEAFTQTEEVEYEHSVRRRILAASLPFVHEFGWTKNALEAGAKSEGLPPVAQGMFPRGGAELVHFFIAKSNADLATILAEKVEEAKAEGLEKPKTKPFIRDAIEIRLRMIEPYLDKWPQAMSIQVLPQNALESWSNLLNLADEIWYHAGDKSIDYNWYTKRITLAGVYKTTEIYMLQDKSPDLIDTWTFLDRRLGDLQTFGATKKSCEQSMDVFKESLVGVSIMARNILGMNSRNR